MVVCRFEDYFFKPLWLLDLMVWICFSKANLLIVKHKLVHPTQMIFSVQWHENQFPLRNMGHMVGFENLGYKHCCFFLVNQSLLSHLDCIFDWLATLINPCLGLSINSKYIMWYFLFTNVVKAHLLTLDYFFLNSSQQNSHWLGETMKVSLAFAQPPSYKDQSMIGKIHYY